MAKSRTPDMSMSMDSSFGGGRPRISTRREGKQFLLESGLVCSAAALLLIFIAFCSPYWIVSWPRVHSGFKRIGLWEACFAGMVLEFDPTQKAYHGCWWILAPEYGPIRGWMMPGWFIYTQVVMTLCFVAEVINFILLGMLWIAYRKPQQKRGKKRKNPLVAIQTATGITVGTAVLMTSMCVVFGVCFYTDRQWLPNPFLNYPSWSYGLAICSTFFSIFSAMAFVTYVMIVRQEMREPPRAVPLQAEVLLPHGVRDTRT